MMMGPEPMMRIFFRSVRLGIFALLSQHEVGEFREEVVGVLGARRRLGVVLDAEGFLPGTKRPSRVPSLRFM